MFKDFVSLYKPYKKLFFLDIFSALMMTGIDMLFPLSVSYLVDNVIPARNMRILCILCIAVLLGYIVKYFFEKVVIYYGHVLGVSLENSLRKRVFEQYEKFSFSYFDENRTGNIISRLTTDAFDISEFAHHGPEDFFISVFILIGSFVILMKTRRRSYLGHLRHNSGDDLFCFVQQFKVGGRNDGRKKGKCRTYFHN